MPTIKKRKCIVCGKEYEYCNNCKSHIGLPAWKAIYCDENCRNIMNISTDYMAGCLTKTAAKLKLDTCDLSDKKSFKESVLNVVNEIYASKKSTKAEVKKATDDVIDNADEVLYDE